MQGNLSPSAPQVHVPVTATNWGLVGAAAGVSVFVAHFAVATIAGRGSGLKRAEACASCTFLVGSQCRCSYWRWSPLRFLPQRARPAVCPFCYDTSTVDAKYASEVIARRYWLTLAGFLLTGVPLFLGWVWALARLS